MTTYSQGEVILTEIAFSGEPGRKRRPAVIISCDDYNKSSIKLIVAAITSNISPPFRRGDLLIDDWHEAGLVKPSSVRGVIATVDRQDIVRVMGRLSNADFDRVISAVAHALLGLVQ